MDKLSKVREATRDLFFKELAKDGNMTRAAQAVGWHRVTAARLKSTDAEFAARCEEAFEAAVDRLEEEAHRRAVKGTVRPVYYQGSPVYLYRSVIGPDGLPERLEDGTEKREVVRDEHGQPVQAVEYQYSDQLLALLLKANNRRKFGDKQEITGVDGGPLRVEATETERARRVAFLLARGLAAVGNEHEPQLIEHQPIDEDEDLI